MSGPETLPALPAETSAFLEYVSKNSDKPLRELIQPYLEYESKLRGLFAQDPSNGTLADNLVGLVPVFAGQEDTIKIKSRNLETESDEEKAKYIMSLNEKTRRKDGERAIVDFDEFKKNFALFSEGALHNLDWTNIVAAGSSVLTPLIPVPEEHRQNKRSLRDYYHEKLAPTSDVDLFIYGTKDEEVAIKRMEAVEATIRDNLLWETTTIRTKNTVTIVSQYPNRHVQIVLRLYSSISEILTGFDVSCACVAYDGQQVYANPRAITSWMLQCNDTDLTRRSPSYEFRLSKYRQRGFEVYYPGLMRDKIDPTIYERNINRLKGLSKLLVLERLPDAEEREAYLEDRRNERGRPTRVNQRSKKILKGDLKAQGAEVAEWDVAEEEQSNYHTISIPYGKPHNAKRSEKLLFQKDMLLNAEWNKRAQKERAGYLHRHPAFIGSVKDVVGDCCGYCPEATTDEEKELQEKDDKTYVRGKLAFMKDDPGRQEIGSFNPITEEDWTELAYIDEDETLCQAIVAKDAEAVKQWLSEEGHDVNRRDHTGRTPLHLAALASTPEIVKLLLDAGARMVWRVVDGRTALHFAASRGDAEIIKLLILKSQENETARDEREDKEREAKGLPKKKNADGAEDEEMADQEAEEEDEDMEDEENEDEEEDIDMLSDEDGSISARTGASSFVEINKKKNEEPESGGLGEEDEAEDDILDIDLADWDYQMAPLHYAVINGHKEAVEMLVGEFGADVMQPIKVAFDWQGVPRSALLSLSLIVNLKKKEEREIMLRTLLELGASSAQGDMSGISAFTRIVQMGDIDCLKILFEEDAASALAAAKHVSGSSGWRASTSSALIVAIRQGDADKAMLLLEKGVNPIISFDAFVKALKQDKYSNQTQHYQNYQDYLQQPAELALEAEMPEVFAKCLELGTDPSLYTAGSHPPDDLNGGENRYRYNSKYLTLLDLVKQKIKYFQTALEDMRDQEKKDVKKNETKTYLPEPTEFDKDSYEYWMAYQMIATENEARKQHNKALEKAGGTTDRKDPQLVKEKEEILKSLEKSYKGLAELLVSKGAKTFKELQPEIWKKANQNKEDDDNDDDSDDSEEDEEKAKPEDNFEIKFTFSEANKDDKVNEAYQELYKAAWSGDEETLKKYTTSSWDEEKTPLLIATKNQLGYTLFSVAVYRKQPKEFLDLILSIATAQYSPAEEQDRQYDPYYEESDDYSDDGSTDDEAELRVNPVDLTEGKLTVDNIASLGKEVKSKTKAADIIGIDVPIIFTQTGAEETSEEGYKRSTNLVLENWFRIESGSVLLQAIVVKDIELVTYLTSTIEKLNGPQTTPTEHLAQAGSILETNISILLESIPMIEDLMKRQGVGPLFKEKNKGDGDKDEDDDEVVGKPKHYLGLTIHGKKRKDWATAANPNATSNTSGSSQQPVALHAAYFGSHKVYEWLATDGPENAIREWQKRLEDSKDAEDNYYLKILRKADSSTIKRWMGVDHPLLLHAIVLNREYGRSKKITDEQRLVWYESNLKYFLDKNPALLESKENELGLTPLLLAASINNKYALQALINLGGDLYAKTPDRSLNAIHLILNGARAFDSSNLSRDWKEVRDCLEILPEDFKAWGFTQRALGEEVSYTPLAYYMCRKYSSYYSIPLDASMIKLALKHSKGVDLGVRTSLGDMPLHLTAKMIDPEIMQILLDVGKQELTVMENANGMTALELADAKRYQHIVGNLPSVDYNSWGTWTYDNSATKMSVEKENVEPDAKETEKEKEERIAKDVSIRYEDWGISRDDADAFKVWAMLDKAVTDAVAGGANNRSLVSLREANETAERLARRHAKDKSWKKKRSYYYYRYSTDEGEDIVSKWLP